MCEVHFLCLVIFSTVLVFFFGLFDKRKIELAGDRVSERRRIASEYVGEETVDGESSHGR